MASIVRSGSVGRVVLAAKPPSHDGGHDGVSTVPSIVEDIDLVNGKIDQHTAAHLLACIVAWIT